MEKTLHITIAKTLFPVEESAYERLSSYLDSLKAHFRGEADREEIIRDIESRIAEKLLEKKHRTITDADVAAVIAEIGDSSQFEGAQAETEEPVRKKTGEKKLYRNPDDTIIAGVASGIAAYFNIDPLIVRSIFAVSIFFGGTGIAVYLLLWLLIPEATSASQKLEMRGDRVTLEGISRVVKDRVAETKERGTLKKVLLFPVEILSALMRFLRNTLFPAIGKIVGAFLTGISFFGILGLTGFLSVIIANWDKPYLDHNVRAAIPETLLSFSLGAGYVVLLIPLLFILFLGFRMVRGRSVIGSGVGFGLVGIWCLAVIASGAAATRIAGDYYAYTSTHPDFQEVTRPVETGAFDTIRAENVRIVLRHGDEQSVALEGKAMDMERVKVELEEDMLRISPVTATSTCFLFCHDSRPVVMITTPSLSLVEMNGGNISLEEFEANDLRIDLRRGSIAGGRLIAKNLSLETESSSFRARLSVETLSLKGTNTHFDLEGSAAKGTLSLLRSNFSGESFDMKDAEVRADQSHVQLGEIQTLRLKDTNSYVTYRGEPDMTEL